MTVFKFDSLLFDRSLFQIRPMVRGTSGVSWEGGLYCRGILYDRQSFGGRGRLVTPESEDLRRVPPQHFRPPRSGRGEGTSLEDLLNLLSSSRPP